MDHELAKELKDAGFPRDFQLEGKYDCIIDGEDGKVEYDNSDYPTLAELIEACVIGEAYFQLKREIDVWIAETPKGAVQNWQTARGHGSTPEEAVAKLYIALQQHT